MNKRPVKRWVLGITVVLLVGLALWRWRSSLKPNPKSDPSTPQAMANNAKAKLAKLAMKSASVFVTGISGDKLHVQSKVVIENSLPAPVTVTGLVTW